MKLMFIFPMQLADAPAVVTHTMHIHTHFSYPLLPLQR